MNAEQDPAQRRAGDAEMRAEKERVEIAAKDYLAERVVDQMDWHSKKSSWNKKVFLRLQVVVILSSALLPFISALPDIQLTSDTSLDPKYLMGGIGVVVAVLTGVSSLYRFQDYWVEYRRTAESLKQERFRFLTKTPPYDAEESFKILVERVESVLSEQNTKWEHIAKAKADESELPEAAKEALAAIMEKQAKRDESAEG